MIEKIEIIICNGENLTTKEIHVKNRCVNLKQTRQIIMYFTRKITGDSFDSISGYFGLNHATAMHAYKIIQGYIETDKKFAERMSYYEYKIKFLTLDKSVNFSKHILNDLEFEMIKFEKRVENLKKQIDEIKYILEISKL
jgi:hypothetical protein